MKQPDDSGKLRPTRCLTHASVNDGPAIPVAGRPRPGCSETTRIAPIVAVGKLSGGDTQVMYAFPAAATESKSARSVVLADERQAATAKPKCAREPPLTELSPSAEVTVCGARALPVEMKAGGSGNTSRVQRRDPADAIFRDEALQAYRSQQAVSSALRGGAPGGWAVFVAVVLMVVAALGAAAVGHVDITARARGTLQTAAGMFPVTSGAGGALEDLRVRAGQVVSAGEVIGTIESKDVRSELARAAMTVEAVRSRAQHERVSIAPFRARTLTLLEKKAELTRRRLASAAEEERLVGRRLAKYEELRGNGLVSGVEIEHVGEQLAEMRRTKLAFQEQLLDLETQITESQRTETDVAAAYAQELAQAEAQKVAAQVRMQEMVIRASRAGRIEALLVSKGSVVQAGDVVAQIVPLEAPQSAVVFVPERDRAFVDVGRKVTVELDRLPREEFGTVAATVVRVARELAPTSEVVRYLGTAATEGAYVRVELALAAAMPDLVRRHLESGAKVTARIPLRRRRVLGLLFDPFERWLR